MATVRGQISKKLADLLPNILRKDIDLCISLIIESIILSIKNGSRCSFGSFFPKTLKSKIARNPKTGEQISLNERRTIRFRASKLLLKRLNEN
jgi:integration host factor subunit beta